jgi:AcrR family transcriptional regulator
VKSEAKGDSARTLTPDDIIEVANRLVETHGVDALTMRRLSDELAVAVTSIYWHVGNRQQVLDALVDRFLADMGTLRARGDSPQERIASLARQLRSRLLERPHLVGLAHDQAKTALVFRPVQTAIVAELHALRHRGEDAAMWLRALQLHVVGSVLLERTLQRHPSHPSGTGAAMPPQDDADPELIAALSRAVDPIDVFEFGLQALLVALPRSAPSDGRRHA